MLVLGTMPSPKSREVGFYYGHPQNRFWKVLAALFDEPEPCGNEERTAFLLAHRIALWDVLASCTIVGASDASIADPVPNDLRRVASVARLDAVFHHGHEGDNVIPSLRRAAPSRNSSVRSSVDKPRKRTHAPRGVGGRVPTAARGT